MAIPLWAGALTQKDTNSIERVQRIAMNIIKGKNYFEYEECLDHYGLETLEARRDTVCLKFAKKCVKNEKFRHWFHKKSANTRSEEPYIRPAWKTKRYLTSSIPHLTNILNKNLE